MVHIIHFFQCDFFLVDTLFPFMEGGYGKFKVNIFVLRITGRYLKEQDHNNNFVPVYCDLHVRLIKPLTFSSGIRVTKWKQATKKTPQSETWGRRCFFQADGMVVRAFSAAATVDTVVNHEIT